MTSLFAAVVMLAYAFPARAAEPGRTGGILFQQPFGARAFTMGQAYAGLGDDIFAMSYNPASLSRLQESQVAAQAIRTVGETQLGYVGFATPLSPSQALGLWAGYLDTGRQPMFDASGREAGSRAIQRDLLVNLGYARSFSLAGGRLHAGGAGALLRSQLAEELTATAAAFDAGGIFEFRWLGGLASAGAAVSHLGPPIKYTGGLASGAEADPLPATLRFGAGYRKRVLRSDVVSFGAEVDQVPADRAVYAGLGLEYAYRGVGALRFGYRAGVDSGSITFGGGIMVRGLSIDYGIGLAQTLSDIHQLSMTYRFAIPGIKYAEPLSERSPIDALAARTRQRIGDGRLFDALAELRRLELAFPGSSQAPVLRAELASKLREIMGEGFHSRRYGYAVAFQDYQKADWAEAAQSLERAVRADPADSELPAALKEARARQQDAERQSELQKQARNAKLFDLASRAHEAGELDRAESMLEAILGAGHYQPARSLLTRLRAERSAAKRAPRKASRGARVKALPGPTKGEIERSERLYNQAMQLYLRGELQETLEKLREASALDPGSPSVRNFLTSVEATIKEAGSRK